jgi:hypothetical protein
VQIVEKVRTPALAIPIFILAAALGVGLARLLWPATFSLPVAVSAGAAGAAVLLSAVAFWDCLAALGWAREVAPFDPDLVSPQLGALLRRFLPPVALLVGYALGHVFWH